ncbi:HD domain-containing protein [Wukongibacter baidiensis]|uniref:HD-GYP domain-containing protein n=1 Tax=Wukongibacter baidiensis TaxID=1723361 RepID=UPI003D7FDBA7
MQQGLYIGRGNECIERSSKSVTDLSLIARGDGTEVMIQEIKSGENMFMTPGDISELMEFVYILDGEILYEKDGADIVLKKGDYFYVHHLKETVYFKVNSDVKLLYVTTQPLFHCLSKRIEDLKEIALKSQKKDLYTHNHGDRVKDYSVAIGNKLGLSKESVENIAFASLFHDIGKINVPDEILQKPGRLTSAEMELIKKHPIDGAEMVKDTYYEKITKIIIEHHERLDGSGYPYGLMGYEISIEAKIIAVADTFDAMITDRPYRKAVSPSDALNELKILGGIHYDEKVVDAFEKVLLEKGIIKERKNDDNL